MERIYGVSVRSKIAYACPAWYTDHGKGSISEVVLERLDRLQQESLVIVAGAYRRTTRQMLEKDLRIVPIRIYLRYRAAMFRARKLDLELATRLRTSLPPADHDTSRDQARNNITRLAVELFEKALIHRALDTSRRMTFANALKKIGERCMHIESSKQWELFRRDHRYTRLKHKPAVLMEGWNDGAHEFYRGLERLESSMLIQLRTEFIGTNAFLYPIKVRLSHLLNCIPFCPG